MTHIGICELTIIGSENGLAPDRRQAIIWTNIGILLIGPLETNLSEFLIGIHIFSFKKMHLKMSSAKWRPSCLGLNVLTHCRLVMPCDVSHLGQYWLRWWFGIWSHSNHYPNMCSIIHNIRPLKNFSEIWTFSFCKMHWKMLFAKYLTFSSGPNMLTLRPLGEYYLISNTLFANIF